MNKSDLTAQNISRYAEFAPNRDYLYGAETLLFKKTVQQGIRVLDMGCGAGRVARALAARGAEVFACDLSETVIDKVVTPEFPSISVHVADARSLPFPDSYFDLVIFSFNGLDFISPENERINALVEMERVLKPKGTFIFSSHNPVGLALTPRSLFHVHCIKWRVQQIFSGGFFKNYNPDPYGIVLYQATPKRIIQQVENNTSFVFQECWNKTGKVSNRLLLTLFSSWPYYYFVKA